MTSLAGRRIAVTREESQAGPLSRALREAGALPLSAPTLEVVPLHEPTSRRRAVPPFDGFDWILITSPRTVSLLAEAGSFQGPPPRGLRIAVAGERTAAVLAREGWQADVVPNQAGAEPLLQALLEGYGEASIPPGRVLFPASSQAGTALPQGLADVGFHVHRIDLYAPRPRPQHPTWWRDRLEEGLQALTFTSPSAVEGLVRGLADPTVLAALRRVPAGVQGPTTASAARDAGWVDVVEARPRSFRGLVEALAERFRSPPDPAATPDLLRA